MTIGFFHGLTVKSAEKRLKQIEQSILDHHKEIDQAMADRHEAIRVASEENAQLAQLKFKS